MKIVSFPQNFNEKLLKKFEELLNDGKIAEGEFYNEKAGKFVDGKSSIPVSSCGTALFSLLAYYKYVKNKKYAILQSNTMRGVYTVPRLLDMEVFIANSTIEPGFMAMDPEELKKVITYAEKNGVKEKLVIVYSVIGGYLAKAYEDIEAIAKQNNIPLIVDMAHGHYLNRVINSDYADLAFSYYATKILPTGEGGLITTHREELINWLRTFLAYDRFNYQLEVGINLRANELTSYFIYLLMTDITVKEFFRDYRVAIADKFKEVCDQHSIKYLDHTKALDFNGYKFIVFDEFDEVKAKNTILTKFGETSPVFNFDIVHKKPHLTHWCPPTYPSLYDEIVKQ